MQRKIIEINEERCNGCGACAAACHEGAIDMVNGKARLKREDYCDGLGDCLPACPTGAITFTQREAPAYDREAVKATANAAIATLAENEKRHESQPCGCPGSRPRVFAGAQENWKPENACPERHGRASRLQQWPVQIKLAPISAPWYQNAKLLVAADCAAYACGDFHERFMKNYVTLIGCPKLDGVDYAEKLAEIIRNNDIRAITVARMEVPCCGGLEHAVVRAMQLAGKMIPWQVVTLSTEGEILE